MALIGMRDLCWGFGDPLLLENITFQIERGEHVCLIGRNGVGKSTLLKLLYGEMLPDKGDVWRQQGITLGRLAQDVPLDFKGTVFDVAAEGFGEAGKALVEHNRILKKPENDMTPEIAKKRDILQQTLDSKGGWEISRQVQDILSRARLDPEEEFAGLSAGMKRRALFARAAAVHPDVLLLDEPTNHLDIDSIIWLEKFILRNVKTLLFITHDRAFLEKIADRIIELDRGNLYSYQCGYQTYQKRRQAAFEAEEVQNKVFDQKLSQEETWIRQGIKARRKRNQGRVRELIKMREAFQTRRKKIGNVKMRVEEVERTGKLVIEAKDISFFYGETPIIRDFSTVVMRGDKIGIIGPNGIGKTTLLKVLLKEISSKKGSVRFGTRIKVSYFDQLRVQLDEQKTVQENIGQGNDFIILNSQKRHVISYLQDFLFSPERCRTPVHVLSGGEKNRLLLAKLFAAPANVLVLDEPTNDLDTETLDLLEELLFDFKGTLLLISHDRAFLNNVVTSTLSFEGNGKIIEYAGGYDDWLIQRPESRELPRAKKTSTPVQRKTETRKKQKLGYMEKRELEDLPEKLEILESEQKELYQITSGPLFYKEDKEKISRIKTRLEEVEQEITEAFRRWEELERIEKIS